MVKAPIGGRVKTRLARQAGLGRALGFYRHATAALIGRLGSDPRWETLLAVAPDSAITSRNWPSRLRRIRQGDGDLGRRMQRLIEEAPAGPVLVIGSDIPGVTATVIARAFKLLRSHVAVLGPASDGGFWLVGHARRRPVAEMFQSVRWSSPHTLEDTLANLTGLKVELADMLDDVDDALDLASVCRDGVRRVTGPGRRGQTSRSAAASVATYKPASML